MHACRTTRALFYSILNIFIRGHMYMPLRAHTHTCTAFEKKKIGSKPGHQILKAGSWPVPNFKFILDGSHCSSQARNSRRMFTHTYIHTYTHTYTCRLESGDIVAVKRVIQDTRFANRELFIMRSLRHPNVVKLHNFFFTSKQEKAEDVRNARCLDSLCALYIKQKKQEM